MQDYNGFGDGTDSITPPMCRSSHDEMNKSAVSSNPL
jgi:hypothetical protein